MIMYIHANLSRHINGIAYKNRCLRSGYGLVCVCYGNFIRINITTIAVIIRGIWGLLLAIHDDLYSLTVNEHICGKPASAFNVKPASPVIICQCSPESRFWTTVQPLISIFNDRFQSTLCIRKNIIKFLPMYTKCIVTIDHS